MNITLRAHLVFVTDVLAAKAFYSDILGLTLVEENPHFTEYQILGGTLYVEEKNPERAKGFDAVHVGGPTGIVFAVEDIHAMVAFLRARGVRIVVEPVQQVWGGWNAIFADPDGNEFILDQDEE